MWSHIRHVVLRTVNAVYEWILTVGAREATLLSSHRPLQGQT